MQEKSAGSAPSSGSNPLPEALEAGRLGLAMILKRVDIPDIADAARSAGYDALYVDLEYGVIKERAVGPIAARAREVGISCLVRIPEADARCATRCIEAGATGIVVPKISSMDQVLALAEVCDRQRTAGHAVTLVIMLESPGAIALAEEVAAVPGVDILHIGTSDLSGSLGIPGQYRHPKIEDAYRQLLRACALGKKIPGGGGLGTDQEMTRKVIAMGVRFITAGNEWAFMASAAAARAAELRALPSAGKVLA